MSDASSGGLYKLWMGASITALAVAGFAAWRASSPPRAAPQAAAAEPRAELERLERAETELHRIDTQLASLRARIDAAVAVRAKPEAGTPVPLQPPAAEGVKQGPVAQNSTSSVGPGGVATRSIKAVVQACDSRADIYVISAGSKDGVKPGMEFELTRDKVPVMTIVIEKVFPNYASGMAKPGTKKQDVRAGDECGEVGLFPSLPR